MRKAKRGDLTRGDVESVSSGEDGRAKGRFPQPGERVAIRLHGHPQAYVVRADTGADGPYLTELLITADAGQAVDYAMVSPIARRLAHTAVQWIHRAGGMLAFPDDTTQTHTRPELGSDELLLAVAEAVEEARSLGLPARRAVKEKLHLSYGTVDRLIRRAKDEGHLEAGSLPKAPPPRQRGAQTDATGREQR